jgi:hypothetical protein
MMIRWKGFFFFRREKVANQPLKVGPHSWLLCGEEKIKPAPFHGGFSL